MRPALYDDGGPSLPAVWRAIRQAALATGTKEQTPVVKWARPDAAKVGPKEAKPCE